MKLNIIGNIKDFKIDFSRTARYKVGPFILCTHPNHWVGSKYEYHMSPIVDNKIITNYWHAFRFGGIYFNWFTNP